MRTMILLLTVWLAGCTSIVAIDYRPEAAFADYHSFAFTGTKADDEIRSLDGERIEQAVTRELTVQGLKPASADNADLLDTGSKIPSNWKPAASATASVLAMNLSESAWRPCRMCRPSRKASW